MKKKLSKMGRPPKDKVYPKHVRISLALYYFIMDNKLSKECIGAALERLVNRSGLKIIRLSKDKI